MSQSRRVGAALAIAAVGAACTTPDAVDAPESSPPAVELLVFDCGHVTVYDLSIFSPGFNEGVTKELVVPCYLIRHTDGMLFWDAGLPDSYAESPEGETNDAGSMRFQVRKTLVSQLREVSISPTDVDYVAFSHMHFDHVGNANMFTSSTLLIQELEYAAAFGPNAAKTYGDPSLYEELRNNETILLDGNHDVFGDGSVIIMPAPGHTPGHQVLFVDLLDAGPIVLSGDLYHFAENRVHHRVPAFNFDAEMTLQSMERIEAYLAESGATLWIQHDPEQNASIPHSPTYVR